MRWQHVKLRNCKLPIGGDYQLHIVSIDSEGFLENSNEYIDSVIAKWAEYIGFQRVSQPAPDETLSIGDGETTQATKKPRKKPRGK